MGEHDQTRLDSDQKGTSLNPLSESCPSFMNYSSVSPLSNYNPYNKQTVVHSTHFSNTNNDNIENDDLYITTNPLPSSMNMSDDFDKVPVLKFPSFSSPSPIHDEDFLSQDSFSDFSYLSDSNDEEYYNYKERDSHPHLLNACLPAPVDSIHDSKDVHCDTYKNNFFYWFSSDVLSQQSFSDVSDSSLLSLLNSTKSPSDLSPKKKLSCPSSNEKLNSTSTHVEPDVLTFEEEHDSVPLQKVATTTSPLSTDRYKPRNRSSCPHSLTDHKNKTRYSFEDTTDSTAFINRKNYGKEEVWLLNSSPWGFRLFIPSTTTMFLLLISFCYRLCTHLEKQVYWDFNNSIYLRTLISLINILYFFSILFHFIGCSWFVKSCIFISLRVHWYEECTEETCVS